METHTDYTRWVAHAAAALENEAVAELVLLVQWDPGDPWASALEARFALNHALGLVGGDTDESYRPGVDPTGELGEILGGTELLAALGDGSVTLEAAHRADRWLDLLTDRLEYDGRSY